MKVEEMKARLRKGEFEVRYVWSKAKNSKTFWCRGEDFLMEGNSEYIDSKWVTSVNISNPKIKGTEGVLFYESKTIKEAKLVFKGFLEKYLYSLCEGGSRYEE